VLEECITEERSVVLYFRGQMTLCKDVREEIFPPYGGKCLLLKADNWVADIPLMTKRLNTFYISICDLLFRQRLIARITC
jgi:hypothetical protein